MYEPNEWLGCQMSQVHGLYPADARKEHQQRLTEEMMIIIIYIHLKVKVTYQLLQFTML